MQIIDKSLTGFPNFLVFFDNVRVDHLVKTYSTQCSCDGGIGTASVELIYVPGLYRLNKLNIKAPSAATQGDKKDSDNSQSAPKPVTFNWPNLLKSGSRGDSVKELQKTLNDIGFTQVGAIDGIFGKNTKSALIAFQASRSIAADGLCGPITLGELKKSLEAKNPLSVNPPATTNIPNGKAGEAFKIEELNQDGIEDMTNLRIFEKNMFTDKYIMIFDGNIRSRSLSRTGKSMSYSAVDYLRWHDRTTVPIAISMEDAISPSEQLKWMAQGINIDKVKKISSIKEMGFKGKTIEETFKELAQQTIGSNKLYIESDAVVFDRPLQRVDIMGDINEDLRKAQVVDYMVTSSVSSMSSLYVMMNDLVKSILLEYYQDRDGVIRIKPPFWSEPVLKSHTIDPMMILNDMEATNWDQAYSRIIVSGGLEEWQDNDDSLETSILTPVSVYDIDGRKCNSESGTTIEPGIPPINPSMGGGSTTGTYLDQYRITSGYKTWRAEGAVGNAKAYYHQGTDFAVPYKTKLYHVGTVGIVRQGTFGLKSYGGYVDVFFETGPYQGGYVRYGHMFSRAVVDGQRIGPGDFIGLSGGGPDDNRGNTTGPHLHLEVRPTASTTMNPLDYLRKTRYDTVDGEDERAAATFSIGAHLPVGNEQIIQPNSFEKKYGPSVYVTTQPMIKFSTAGAVNSNYGSAFGALDSYAKFLLHYLNSSVDMLNLTTLSMPWLRAGFNAWVDPLGIDKVYYIERISRQGSAQAGCLTTLTLKMGRQRKDFTSGNLIIGALKSGKNDNVFISTMKKTAKDFGEVIDDYDAIKLSTEKYYSTDSAGEDSSALKLSNLNHMKYLYDPNTKKPSPQKPTTSNVVGTGTVEAKKNLVAKVDTWRQILRKNSKGDDVALLQSSLNFLGYSEVGSHDGIFGAKTDAALRRFQKDNQLTVDGICGPKTKEVIKSKIGG